MVDTDPRVKTVWFEPWKYESRQDVGLGLMLAIVRAVEKDKNAVDKAKSLIGKTGAFLVKAFRKTTVSVVNIASAIDLGTIFAESLSEVRAESLNIQSEIDEALDLLRELIKAWVGKNGRCFVFVDDLDRCLPEQMISLVEALHLYMADTPCYFTVGIDREAISTALNNRYPGLNSDLGRVYLDKIFPVSMNLSPPTNRQLLAKYRRLLEGENLGQNAINFVFESVEQNPRSIERFINNYSLSRRQVLTKGTLTSESNLDLLVLLTVIRVKFPDLFAALQRVPREAVSQFVVHTKSGDQTSLKNGLENTGGNGLALYGADGTETKSFFRTLTPEWGNLLENSLGLEKLLAFADI